MGRVFKCDIDEDILEKFNLALTLNKEDVEEVVEMFMMHYISNSFARTSQKYKTLISKEPGETNVLNPVTGKARHRIPRWAKKSNQYNHKIIKAYCQVEQELGYVPFIELERRCSDEGIHPETYVRDFRGNFNQMKFDSPKSHGKVFEIENGNVVIWAYVKDTFEEYKVHFYK